MEIKTIEHSDIHEIANLLPKGWEHSLPIIELYTTSKYCFPIKIIVENKIVGIGTAIINNDTAWLAHIIVNKDNRNQGIGKIITQSLVDIVKTKSCETIYLIATELGEPVYKKVGFEIETEYLLFKDIKLENTFQSSENIIGFTNEFKEQLANLDREVSGENRLFQFEQHLSNGFIYLHDNNVHGFYLPSFREGLIIATSHEAGLELMELRLTTKDNASFPVDNINATKFMHQNNFNPSTIQKRMRLGKKRNWQAANIYNRIGGNLG